jgi:hypothetical protein
VVLAPHPAPLHAAHIHTQSLCLPPSDTCLENNPWHMHTPPSLCDHRTPLLSQNFDRSLPGVATFMESSRKHAVAKVGGCCSVLLSIGHAVL